MIYDCSMPLRPRMPVYRGNPPFRRIVTSELRKGHIVNESRLELGAHCGTHIDGSYLYTLTLTDIATGWTEVLPLLNRTQESIIAALKRVQQLLPFSRLRIDTDNGGEFINVELLTFCEQDHITFTRGRPKREPRPVLC